MAVSEAQKRAIRKWEKENTYRTTVQFYKSTFPEEDYERVKAKLAEMGISKNEYILQKFKELLGDE